MFVVRCPECGKLTELPDEAVGPERTDIWNVVHCDQCPVTFSYDDEDVFQMPESARDLSTGFIVEGS